MQTEGAVHRGDRGDGVLVEQDVAAGVKQERKVVEGFDIPLDGITGHHPYDHLDPFFAGLVQILILNVEGGLGHGASLLLSRT